MFPDPALRVTRVIDRFTELSIYVVMLLLAPLIVANALEIILRYAFDSPTTWALDVTVMSNGSLFMLGAAYALLKGAHVRTDLFWEKFSDRTKGIIDSVSYGLLFLPVMAVIFFISVDALQRTYEIGERSNLGLWQPVLWPFRAVVPLSALLLFVQGISELIKSLWAVSTGNLLVHHEKLEI